MILVRPRRADSEPAVHFQRKAIKTPAFIGSGVTTMKRTEVAQYWEANAETWTRHARAGYDIYRDGLNTPAFLDLLPPGDGLLGLDIGCGEGANTRELARLGAGMQAVDVAPTFIRHAQEQEKADPLGIAYLIADATDLPFSSGSFDFATAFMSMMDMTDQGPSLTRSNARFATGRVPSILDPASVLRPAASPNVAGTERHNAGHRGRWLLRQYRWENRHFLDDQCAEGGTRSG
jgi:SAM-dependent methyltransferase